MSKKKDLKNIEFKNLFKKWNGKWEELYSCSELNQRGNIKYNDENLNSQEFYSMKLSETEIFKQFLKIEPSKRKNYKVDKHKGQIDIVTISDKISLTEKRLARAIYNQKITPLGEILDYQVPLKDKRDNKDGEIDLISKKGEETLCLIEIKMGEENKGETLLRALLEICTYYKRLNLDTIKKEYNCNNVKLMILIEKDSYAYKQAVELNKTIYLKELFKNLSENLGDILIYSYEILPKKENIFTIDNTSKINKIVFKNDILINYEQVQI